MATPPNLQFKSNRLLAALPANEYQRLLPSLEAISLNIRDGLYEPGEPIEYVYFPLSGMVSILVNMGDDTLIEVGVVGNEGMVGLTIFLGADQTNTKGICQVAGEAVRMRSDVFRTELSQNGALVSLLQCYTLAYFALIAQSSGCNSQHPISQRCARWLLLTHDRVGKNQFELTQEFLGQMLGVRRAGVNSVMQALQANGIITYSRGIIHILDREGLERAACQCYRIITAQYEQILGC